MSEVALARSAPVVEPHFGTGSPARSWRRQPDGHIVAVIVLISQGECAFLRLAEATVLRKAQWYAAHVQVPRQKFVPAPPWGPTTFPGLPRRAFRCRVASW